ncbi:hypothetical protein HK097_004537, partial [Rhizophlyctis rosea]
MSLDTFNGTAGIGFGATTTDASGVSNSAFFAPQNFYTPALSTPSLSSYNPSLPDSDYTSSSSLYPSSVQTLPAHSSSSTHFDLLAAKASLDEANRCAGLGMQIRVLGVPHHNAKSRVETQVKICLQLVTDQGEKVTGWSGLKLPEGLLARERGRRGKAGFDDQTASPPTLLHLTATVLCASDITRSVQTCLGCVQRERKRTKKKEASASSASRPLLDTDEETLAYEQKRVILFSTPQIVEFSSGDTILPTRITCYCRHHGEKVGFCIYYVLRSNTGEIVATGLSPPIMITDDHKSAKQAIAGIGGGRKRMRVDLEESVDSSPLPSTIQQQPSPPTNMHSPDIPSFLIPPEQVMSELVDRKVIVPQPEVDLSAVQAVLAQSGLVFVPQQQVQEEMVREEEGPKPPVITRVIPGEGPVSGGVEVTILGSSFH